MSFIDTFVCMSIVKGKIIANLEQLDLIGCSRPLTGLILEIKDIDRWSGIEAPCSTVIYYHYVIGSPEEYIIPTKWIQFENRI